MFLTGVLALGRQAPWPAAPGPGQWAVLAGWLVSGHAAGLGMLAGGTTRSVTTFSTWAISVLPPIATEQICPVLRSTLDRSTPFPSVYTHAHTAKTICCSMFLSEILLPEQFLVIRGIRQEKPRKRKMRDREAPADEGRATCVCGAQRPGDEIRI